MFHSFNIVPSYLRGTLYEHNFIRVIVCAVQMLVLYVIYYMLSRHVLLFSFTHCRRHSVASVSVTSGPFFVVRLCSSTGVVLSRLSTVGATLFSMVLTVQATMLLAFPWVLTV